MYFAFAFRLLGISSFHLEVKASTYHLAMPRRCVAADCNHQDSQLFNWPEQASLVKQWDSFVKTKRDKWKQKKIQFCVGSILKMNVSVTFRSSTPDLLKGKPEFTIAIFQIMMNQVVKSIIDNIMPFYRQSLTRHNFHFSINFNRNIFTYGFSSDILNLFCLTSLTVIVACG